MTSNLWRISATVAVGAAGLCTALAAQRNSSVPQPMADRLPPVGVARPSPGTLVDKPAAVMPTVPAGFTVSIVCRTAGAAHDGLRAKWRSVRQLARRQQHHGVARRATTTASSNRAASTRRARPPRAGARRHRAGAPLRHRPAPATVVNPEINGPILGAKAPACVEPPPFANRGPGTLAAPFGLAFNDGYLYVGNPGSIIRYKYTNGDLKAQGEPEKLIDLPTGGHSTRNIVFNRAGTKMYVAVGSQSNNNAGEDCRRAAILEFNPDGTGYRVYASGIRNPVGLTLQPGTDIVWTAMNERDNLGDDLVPDYATSVKDGGFYGWPYSYIGTNYDPRYVGAFPDLVKRAIVPDVLIPAHSAALGITFYTGTQFPQRYRNGGFVALHGSWNRSVAAGYKVVFFPMTNGKPGPLEDFLTGFLVKDGAGGTRVERWGRPVGVTVARDGGLLVSDDGSNRIWKISAGPGAK